MNAYNRASTHSTPKDYDRKDSGWFKEWLDEDAPVNATGVAVSTDKPIVKKKKKKKDRDKDWSLGQGHNEVGTPDIVKRFKNGTPYSEQIILEAIDKSKLRNTLQKIKGVTNKQIQAILTLPPVAIQQMITQVSVLVSGDENIIERDYQREREIYLGTPEQKKRNAARKRARRALEKEGKVKPFDGKDVHHKDNNPENNDPKNLKAVDRSWNRREPRLREDSYDSLSSAQKVQLLKLYSKGMDLMSGTPAFKKNQAEIDKLRKKFKLEELDEGKLVADIGAIFSAIAKQVKNKMGKEYQSNQERGLAFINQVASLVGGKVSDKKQAKGKLFYKTR